MAIEKNLRLIDCHTFLINTLFILPVLLPFFKDIIGLGYQELLLSEAAFSASAILFDVPTSWISDIWQRKSSLALGTFLSLIGLSLFLIAHNFWHAIAAQIICGTGMSLLNGTNAAFLYDTLQSVGREGEYRRREGKRQAFGLYGIAASAVIGGYLYTIDPYLPLALTLFVLLLALLMTFAMHEPDRHKKADAKHPVADIVQTVSYVMHGHAELGIIVSAAAILFCVAKILMWSQQPYFMALDLPKFWYGILISAGFVLGGLSSHWSHLFENKSGAFYALVVGWLAAFGVCLGSGLWLGYSGIVFLMLGGTCIYGTLSPRVNAAINQSVDSSRRATALSTQTMLTSALFIPVSSVVGWTTDHWTIQYGLFALALWLFLTGTGLFLFRTIRAKTGS